MSDNSVSVQIEKAIEELLAADDFKDIKITAETSAEANRILANIKATKRGVSQDLELTIDSGKSEIVSERFKREAYVLTEIIPLFSDLQKYLKIQSSLTTFPKCYNTFNQGDIGYIVLENLEKSGFEKIKGDLNEYNYKLVLKTIAQFHGLSLGLRYLHPEKFNKVLGSCRTISKSILAQLAQFFNSRLEKLKFNLKLLMRLDLLKKFEDALEDFSGEKITEILNDTVENSVLVHGNIHHNSVLLKLQGENATGVALEGFQESGLHSPIIDLSHYYFSGIGHQYFNGVPDFLKYYYEELSSFLKTLGCNAEEIFSFNTLLDHWQRYSFYGFCFALAYTELRSFKLEDALADFIKAEEDSEVSHVAPKTPREPRRENNAAHRNKLVKMVESFLDSGVGL